MIVNFLLNSTTGKSADAKRLNIPIITEEEYQKFKNFS